MTRVKSFAITWSVSGFDRFKWLLLIVFWEITNKLIVAKYSSHHLCPIQSWLQFLLQFLQKVLKKFGELLKMVCCVMLSYKKHALKCWVCVTSAHHTNCHLTLCLQACLNIEEPKQVDLWIIRMCCGFLCFFILFFFSHCLSLVYV